VPHPEPTKVFLKLSPEMAMLSAPYIPSGQDITARASFVHD